jgi:hypothetical protein
LSTDHPDDDAPDAQVLEWAKGKTISAIRRAIEAKLGGAADEAEVLAAAAEGMGERTNVRLYERDLREIGVVNDLPRMFWHWVYRDRKKPGKVIILSWAKRMQLQQQGYIDLDAFTNEGMN